MIEGVIGLEPELGSHIVSKSPVLIERRIPILIARASKIGKETRCVAKCIAAIGSELRVCESPRIEPLVNAPVGRVNISNYIRPRIAAEGSDVVA